MIIVPSIRPDTIKGPESDFGTSIAASIWRKIVNNHTWIEKSLPIGSILFFQASTTEANGTPIDPPNPNIWTICDGSVINDIDSPMNGQATPNLKNKFPKGASTDLINGGNSTINIQHSHGGRTGVTDDRADVVADIGVDHSIGAPHYHSINNQWSTAEPIIPKYFAVQAFIRYK